MVFCDTENQIRDKMKVGVCGDNVPNLPGNPKVKTIGSTLLSYPVMCCLAPFLGCSYLEQSKLGSHILFTQVHLGLTEKDGQRPESEQCGHAEESVDPQSRALLGNLAADQEAIRRTNPLFVPPRPCGQRRYKSPQAWTSSPHRILWAITLPWSPCPWPCGSLVLRY